MSAPKKFKPSVDNITASLKQQVLFDLVKANLVLRVKYNKVALVSCCDLNDCMTLGRGIFSAMNYIRKGRTPNDAMQVTLFAASGAVKLAEVVEAIKPQLHADNASMDAEKKQAYWGMMMPIMTMLTNLKLRIDEIRNGTTIIFGTKTGVGEARTNKKEKIGKWGLNSNHAILLDGITYPPESCSSICQSLGVMTNIINMINQDSNYDGKFYDAALYQIGFIPNSTEILDFIRRRKTGTPTKVLTMLGNLLLLTGTRQAYRYSFPIEILYVTDAEKTVGWGLQVAAGGAFVDPSEWPMTHQGSAIDIDFSGRKGATIYRQFMGVKWKLKLGKGMSESETKQILFHAMTNTQHTEFGLLNKITTFGGWKSRHEIGRKFREKGEGTAYNLSPVTFVYISKLLTACPTKMITQQNGALFSSSAFSEKINKKFNDEHFKAMEEMPLIIV